VVGANLDTGALGYWITPGSTGSEGGGALIPQSALTIGPGGLVTAFRIPENCIGPNDDCTGAPSGTLGSPVEAGSATFPGSTQMVFWGRWDSGTIIDSGQTFSLSSTNQGHFMYGPLTPGDVIAAKTGTLMLQSTFPGGFGTTPTNNFGATPSSVVFPTIMVNFTARTATFSSSDIFFPSQNWFFSGGVAPITVLSQGAFFHGQTSGSCSGTNCNSSIATGQAAGIFLGPNGDHAGVVLSGNAGTSNFGTVRVYCPTC
jgi:hypothetical protein